MLNVCFNCGEYRPDKFIDPAGPYAVCPECGYKHTFLRLPLLIITGASGAGKSTLCRFLTGTVTGAVLLDSDILWRDEFNRPEVNRRDYFETWLRMCKNISQAGRPVVLFGAGIGVPENIEPCVEGRYFSMLHYLALTCNDNILTERLRRRPKWRQSSAETFIMKQVDFNRWFKEKGSKTEPPIAVLDTTERSIEETVIQAEMWIKEKINHILTI